MRLENYFSIVIYYIISMAFPTLGMAFEMAGGMDSGGGPGILCFSKTEVANNVRNQGYIVTDDDLVYATNVTTLDLFEARLPRGNETTSKNLLAIKNDENYHDYLNRIIMRIEKYFPKLANKIIWAQDQFKDDQLIWTKTSLIKIDDSFPVVEYNSGKCTLVTIAAQFKEENSYYLSIDSRIFNLPIFKNDDRAIFFLHEYLYLVARNMERVSSRSTRMAIYYLLLDDGKTTVYEIANKLKNLAFLTENEYQYIIKNIQPTLIFK